ncbi:hypothetical protein [Microvirga arabica]|uniref:hypothetical protein n=1 Tax=Microvirga arabica TaxID=1128671 RepID=UPI00193A2C20|nr:hypothetical protein [Microvirga arabica]MBM1169410.1 hypothetical protein [Microvirga arabica]
MAAAIPVVKAMTEEEKTAAKGTETAAAKVTVATMPTAAVAETEVVTLTTMTVVEREADGAVRMVRAAAEVAMEGRGEAAARAEEVPKGAALRETAPVEELPEEPAPQVLGRLIVKEEEPTSKVAMIAKPVV